MRILFILALIAAINTTQPQSIDNFLTMVVSLFIYTIRSSRRARRSLGVGWTEHQRVEGFENYNLSKSVTVISSFLKGAV